MSTCCTTRNRPVVITSLFIIGTSLWGSQKNLLLLQNVFININLSGSLNDLIISSTLNDQQLNLSSSPIMNGNDGGTLFQTRVQNQTTSGLFLKLAPNTPQTDVSPELNTNLKSKEVSPERNTQPPYTPAQQCRLELEKWLNPMIDELLQMGEEMPPLIDWVWDMDTYFLVNMMFNPVFAWNKIAFLHATWNWQDQFGNNFTIDGILGKKHRPSITLPYIKVPSLNVTNQTERSIPVFLWASNVNVPENKTVRDWVYDLRSFLKCDQIETRHDRPLPGTKIGMCVRFRGSHHLLPPFIAYHRLIGVQHFWFYTNEEFNITDLPVARDVTYVPYRFVWTEHKNYSRIQDKDGVDQPWRLAFGGANFWQPAAMQQCLYRLKRYDLDWLMTNDVDEYLWVNKTESIMSTTGGSNRQLRNISVLQEFLNEYESIPDLGGLAVEGWSFGSNETRQEKVLELVIDYISRAQQIVGGRRKIIYRVPNAKRINVHWLYEGGRLLSLSPSDIRWNHYRTPQNGIFRRGKLPVVTDSSLPDAYRALIMRSLQ